MKKNASSELIEEINSTLKSIMWGSVEIIVQDNEVTQITVKNIKKTKVFAKKTTESENSKNQVSSSQRVLTNKKQKYINVYNN